MLLMIEKDALQSCCSLRSDRIPSHQAHLLLPSETQCLLHCMNPIINCSPNLTLISNKAKKTCVKQHTAPSTIYVL